MYLLQDRNSRKPGNVKATSMREHTENTKGMLERMPCNNFLTIIIILLSQSNYYSTCHLDGLASQTVL